MYGSLVTVAMRYPTACRYCGMPLARPTGRLSRAEAEAKPQIPSILKVKGLPTERTVGSFERDETEGEDGDQRPVSAKPVRDDEERMFGTARAERGVNVKVTDDVWPGNEGRECTVA